jgi:hypothetical protein
MSSTLKTKIAADNSDNNSIISDKNISSLELPTGKPIIYEYEKGKLIDILGNKLNSEIKKLNPNEDYVFIYQERGKIDSQSFKGCYFDVGKSYHTLGSFQEPIICRINHHDCR